MTSFILVDKYERI